MNRAKQAELYAADESSSPDPLNDSLSDQRSFIASSPSKNRDRQIPNTKHRRTPSNSQRIASSPVRLQHNGQISPSKTVTEQTLSPWKIRVTVEAEPEDEETERIMQTYTRTTTIPLRGNSSPIQSIETSSTGRGRRSASQTRAENKPKSRSRQRSGTPKPGRRRKQSVTDLDIVVLGDEEEENEWGTKSRRRSTKKDTTKSQSELGNRPRTRGISSMVDSFELAEDENQGQSRDNNATLPSQSPELREIDFNKISIRSRSNSIKHKVSGKLSTDGAVMSKENIDSIQPDNSVGLRKVSVNSMRSYPTPSPTPSESDQDVAARHEEVDHPDGFDTVIESEGFTMIDLDSIPSVRQLRSSPLGAVENEPHTQEDVAVIDAESHDDPPTISLQAPTMPTPGKAFPSYLYLAEGESDISSAVPSSPPLPTSQIKAPQIKAGSKLQIPSSISQSRHRQVTPQTYSSPRLPSPPRPTPPQNKEQPDPSKALNAGARLQGALASQTTSSKQSQPRIEALKTPRDHTSQKSQVGNGLFGGFDSGTQRELRAGLRFGEELAKKAVSSPLVQKTNLTTTQHMQPQVFRVQVPQQTIVDPLHARSGARMDQDEVRSAASGNKGTPTQPNGNHSQVIIHDITMEDADDDDIWLAEAKHSSSSPRESYQREPHNTTDGEHVESVKTSFQKPWQIRAPKVWNLEKQGSLDEHNSTTLMTGDGESSMSGLFWKSPRERDHDFRFGAGQIKETRRELRQSGVSSFGRRDGSGTFDISKMLGTPKRIRESLEKQEVERTSTSQESTSFSEEEISLGNDESSIPYEEDSATEQPQTIPVNFHDSTLSQAESSPYKAQRSLSPSAYRPPTPRSAIKGSRQGFGTESGQTSTDNSDAAIRKVIWARRTSYMNEDWVESSHSMDSDDISSVAASTSRDSRSRDLTTSATEEDQIDSPQSTEEIPQEEPKPSASVHDHRRDEAEVSTSPKLDTPLHMTKPPPADQAEPHSSFDPWQQTARNISAKPKHTTSSKHSTAMLPSYLKPPSYPSDPKRSISKPLSSSGEFTNVHFRTLHIIYAKSSRPRFHAPQIEECRPEIRKLVTEKWQLHIDEDRAGLGGFTFKVGEAEGRVLERFCREVEWGQLSGSNIDEIMHGIWGGLGHSQAQVHWEWTCVNLAEWLGRIVVGEVVRNEEFGGRQHK